MANTKIQSEQIADSAITTDRIASDAITTAKIADNVALGGSPTTTTQSSSDNSTKIATTAYVTAAVNAIIDSAPDTLNTLNEIAAALNDDANFNTTVTNSIAAKLPLAGGTMTGALNMGSQNITNAGTISAGSGITSAASFAVTGGAAAGISEGLLIDWSTNLARFLTYDSSTGSEIAFYTQPSGGSPTQALRIDSSQNATFAGTISCGAIASGGNLHAGDGTNISMDGSANGQLEVDGNGYQGAIALDGSAMHVYHNSSVRSLILGTNETARITIGGSGNVDFHSNNLTSVGTINSGAIQIGDSLGSGYGITVDPNTQYGAIVQTTESTPSANPNLWCRIDDDGTVSTLFRVQNNGLVGIGGTTPDYPLDISYQTHGLYNQHRPSSGVGVGQEMYYSFNTSNGTEETFSSIYTEITSNTDGAESGAIALRAKNAGTINYVLRGDGGAGVKLYGAGTEYWSLDSSGNVLHQGGSPEYHFGTTSATHANWRIAVQEVVNQGFEIASGTTSAGANAASDTYTTRFQITSDGEVKLPGTTSHTYLHIAANSGVGAANKYTSGSTTFTAGMDSAAGIPDNMYGIASGSSGSSQKALIADSSARVTVGHGNPNGLGRLSVHGTVGHGNVLGDPDISRTYTNVTSVDGSTIELVSATAFTISSGDTCVVTWNKGSWASVMYDAQISFASGGAHQTGSFYHNNSGSAWSGHVAKEHYDNTGVTWIAYGGSNQTVIWTFTFPSGYHPILRLKVTAGGGSGYVAANEFSVVWTT